MTIFIPTTYAGACSSHGGVNCLAGHDSDGSVICNDGWTESSVQYTEIKDICLDNYLEPGPFFDVTQSDPNREAILYLYDKSIINGYPDLTFKPKNEINRAELLKILIEGSGITPTLESNSNCFTDVTTDWYAPYVCYGKSIGWVDGYPDGSFKPAQTVNKVEAIKMLINSQNIEVPTSIEEPPFADVPTEEWFAPFVSTAKNMDILEETGNTFSPSELMTRGSISENLFRLLTYNQPEQKENITLELPESWITEISPNPNQTNVLHHHPDEDTPEETKQGFIIQTTHELTLEITDLQELFDHQYEECQKNNPEPEEYPESETPETEDPLFYIPCEQIYTSELTEIEVDGFTAYRSEIIGVPESGEQKETLYLPLSTKIIELKAIYFDGNLEEKEETYNEIFQSLTIE